MPQAISTVQNLRHSNRALLLELLRQQSSTRVELAQKTGLAKSAVTTIVNELIQEGLVQEQSAAFEARAGRPAIMLEIRPRKKFAIGLILNRSSTLLCAVDLQNHILHQTQVSTSSFRTTRECTGWIFQTVDGWFSQPETPKEDCIGFSIGAAGPVDRKRGIIKNPPAFDRFHNYPIVELVKARYELPVTFENVAVLFAQAEYLNGPMQNYHNTLFLFWVENGVGSVLLNDGQPYSGLGGYAGEIGHTCVNPNGIACACGNIGCLEAYLKKETVEARFGTCNFRTIMDGATLGDPDATEIVDYFVRYIGIALSNAVNLFDPDSICLYLPENYKPTLFLERLSQYIHQHAVVCKSHRVDLFCASVAYTSPSSAAIAPMLTAFIQNGGRMLPVR